MGFRQLIGVSLGVYLALSIQLPSMAQENAEDRKNRAIQLYNESVPLIQAFNYERAESKLEEANKLDPNNYLILCNYGLSLMKLGRMKEAREMLEKSLSVNPKFDVACLNLGLVCEGLGDLVNAKIYLGKFIEHASSREQAERMKDHINAIDKTLASGMPTPSPNAENYLGEIQRNQLNPWPKDRMPVKIYIAPATAVPGYKASFGDALQHALDAWATVLKGELSFSYLKKQEGADIFIHWSNDTSNAVMKAEGGDCKHRATGAGMDHADVTLLTIDPSPSVKLNDALVSWVSLHEIGHALGVSGHSSNPADVMYFASPQKYSMPSLSERDIRTFTKLYSEKLPETWLSLNDQSVRLMSKGKLDEALEKLTQAQKMSPDEKVIRENMMLLEGKKATALINANQLKDAEIHLLKALEMEKEFHDQNYKLLQENYAVLLKNAGRASEVKAMFKRYEQQ